VNNTAVARPPDLNERILVRELTHRINNQLTSAINVVTAAAVRTHHLEAKAALGNVDELLQEQANVHRVLAIPEDDALVDAAQYLRRLCLTITRSSLEPSGIHLSFQADTLPLEAERCWRLGMAIHELVTNSARHACFDGRTGEIKIKLSLAASTEDDQFAQADHDTTAPECRRHSVGPAWAYSGIKRAGRSPPLRGGPNDRRGGRPRAVARKTRI
jgi:two-component sensor histidine kinase